MLWVIRSRGLCVPEPARTFARIAPRPSPSSPAGIFEWPWSHGLNVVVVEYTLAPEARMDRIVGEVRRAISWLHKHLADYGADPGRIYVAGHSAGGHLTAMTMPLGAVRGGIVISGLYGLEPVRLNYLNEKLRLDEAEAQRNSPMLN